MGLYRAHVLVCTGTGCASSGGKEVLAKFEEEIKKQGLDKEIKAVSTGCHGMCEMGPIVTIYPEGTFYVRVKPEDVPVIIEEHLLKGRIVSRLLYTEPKTAAEVPDYKDIPFYKKQRRIVLENCGDINPDSLEEYIGKDGYPLNETEAMWGVIIHLAFVASGVLLALMDWLSARTEKH